MLYALFSMVLLTFIIALMMVISRVYSLKKGELRLSYFKLNQGQEAPEFITKLSNNFNNQFQVPLLFYVVGALFVSLNLSTDYTVTLAWCFVGLRISHAIIHLTYNHVLHRLLTYSLAFTCVLLLWVELLLSVQ